MTWRPDTASCDAAPVRCAKLGCAVVALALPCVVLLDPVLLTATAVVAGLLELIKVPTLLAHADCWLSTLAHPEQAVATAG